MLFFRRLSAVVLACALVGGTLPLDARTRKGDKYLAEGRAHEQKKEWDAALDSYEKALSEDPAELNYQMAAQKARFEAAAIHVSHATKVRAAGQLGDALLEFQKAYALDPSSTVAAQEIQRTQEMILRERKRVETTGQQAPPEVRGLTPFEEAKKANADKLDRMLGVPELRPLKPNLIDLRMNNQTSKVLFETVAKIAGLNVLWDPEYASPLPPGKDHLNVDFENSTVEQALDYLAVVTKSFWKPLSPNTIFITMDTTNKRRDYEEEVTKVFYLSNVVTNTDLNEIVTAVRTVAGCTKLFQSVAQNAVVAKCSADEMALTDKIIHDLDKPRPEVVVDIYVIEASSVFTNSIAAALASTGLNVPFNFTPRTSIQVQGGLNNSTTGTATTTTTGGINTSTPTNTGTTGSSTTGAAIPLSSLGHLASSDFSTVLPSALLQATMSDTRTKVLQSPEIRAVNGQKATMKIGEKEPTAVGSFGSTLGAVAGAGISPLVNTQFQYIDVGVNIEITPYVHANNEITLHVSVDISNITGQANLGGVNQPIIGQRKIEHDIRLREGEVSLLGGLLSLQDTKTKTGIPGLSSIPLLGRLFSGTSLDQERDELMIALVPHIVRQTDITPENLAGVASGNQNVIHVSYGPKPEEAVAPKEAPAAAPVASEAQAPAVAPATSAATPPVAALPATAPPATAPPGTAPPATTPPATAPPVTAPPETTPPATAPPGTAPVIVLPATAPPATAPPTTAPPATAPPATAPPATAPPATAPPATAPAATAPSETGVTPVPSQTKVRFDATQIEKSQDDTFTVSLMVDSAKDVVGAPIEVQFDPKAVSLTDIVRGSFWGGEGDQAALTKNVVDGNATIRVVRPEGAPGISGSGPLVTLTFKALARGSTSIRATNVTLETFNSRPVTGTAQVAVNVK